MRVFVTGASGFIGSAVVPELLAAGHQVIGLARSADSAAAITAAGAGVHRGTIDDLDSIREGAARCDGVIHLAYNHDFADMAAAAEVDLGVVEAIGATLAGTDRPFVVTTGTLGLTWGRSAPAPDRPGNEDDVLDLPVPRVASETTTVALAERGVRSSVVRLSPSVHGEGDRGFVPMLIGVARKKGVSAFVGDGMNRWPAVHRLDAAHLYRLAVEAAPAGARLHGVGDPGIPLRDIAAVIGRHLDLPVQSISADQADAHFGFLGRIVSADNPTSSALTQQLLGWQPTHRGLIDDLDQGHYFA